MKILPNHNSKFENLKKLISLIYDGTDWGHVNNGEWIYYNFGKTIIISYDLVEVQFSMSKFPNLTPHQIYKQFEV